jgi:Ca-activated chloride channel homolog
MKTTLQLDYPAILANTARPVHLALTFDAPEVTGARSQPVAFVAVIDRSGSMAGAPLAAAKRAVRGVVRNLRRGDFFGLAVFDTEARVLVPLSAERNVAALNLIIDGIEAGDSTNLSGGWCLGRDLLADAPAGSPRKLLLLTDGQLNAGVTEPALVAQMAEAALDKHRIRTSCLGFGPGYNEDLLEAVAKATGGALHDANQPDHLPEVFRKELDGLQSLVVQNLRLRASSCGFVERIAVLGDYVETVPPQGGKEVSVGDLVSGEQRVVVLALDVLPIPPGADGRVVTNWDGEDLLDLEIRYDVITAEGLVSRTETHRVKVRPVQSPEDVRVNEEVLPWVTLQSAAAVVERAIRMRDAGQRPEAVRLIEQELARLAALPPSDLVADARRLLETARQTVEEGDEHVYNSVRKSLRSMKRFYSMGSSADDMFAVTESGPSFKKRRLKPQEPSTPASPPAPTDDTPPAGPQA